MSDTIGVLEISSLVFVLSALIGFGLSVGVLLFCRWTGVRIIPNIHIHNHFAPSDVETESGHALTL